MAATAWNATLMDSESRRRLLDEFEIITLAGEDKKTHTEIMKLMKAMIERKERYFSGDKRFVMDFSVTETRDGYRLAVAAAPIRDDTSS